MNVTPIKESIVKRRVISKGAFGPKETKMPEIEIVREGSTYFFKIEGVEWFRTKSIQGLRILVRTKLPAFSFHGMNGIIDHFNSAIDAYEKKLKNI